MTLEELRKINGLKANHIAKELGISRVQYRNYETGKFKPNLDNCDKLARMFGISLIEIKKILEEKKC